MKNWQLVLRKVPTEREPRASFRDEFQPRFEQATLGLKPNGLEPNPPAPLPLRPVAVRSGWQGPATCVQAKENAKQNEKSDLIPRSLLRVLVEAVAGVLRWLNGKKPAARRMRLTETVSLGEKRFVSILEVDGKQILIGSSAGNVSMLAILDGKQDSKPEIKQESILAAHPALEQIAC